MRIRLFSLALILALAIPVFGQLAAPGVDNSPKVGDLARTFKSQVRSAARLRPI